MKKNLHLFLLCTIAFVIVNPISGQIFYKYEADKIVSGSKLVRVNEKNKTIKYLQLEDRGLKSANTLKNETDWLARALKFSNNHSLKVIHQETDKKNIRHVKYQMLYKNIPVEGAVYIVHSMNGNIHSANGEYVLGKDISVIPQLKEEEAYQKAVSFVNAKQYMPVSDNNKNKSKGNLAIISADDSTYVLAYKFDIYAIKPLSRQYVFVNANTGEIIKAINRIHIEDEIGMAKTMYNGNVAMTTDFFDGTYRLRESGRGNGIETYNLHNDSDFENATDFTDDDNNWTDTTNYNQAANDVHYGTEATYDFYLTKFGRNSFDDQGSVLTSYVHVYTDWPNAMWDGTSMSYGDGDSINYYPFTALEIVGHELTHAVTEYSAGLIYSNESGALNESFSDIFGTAIDFYKHPTSANFLHGELVSRTHTPLRNLGNPNARGNPDTYKGLYWDEFYQEVHNNSGVQNYWFYLLCEGGSGVNDLGNSYMVNAIGMEKAIQIAYRSLTVYLTPSSNYADARFYSIQAAMDLYGECTQEVIAVTNAWYAVGVGDAYSNKTIANFTTSKASGCGVPTTICFYDHSIRGGKYLWDFGDGFTDATENPVHTYNKAGSFTIRLIANGPYICSLADTVEKVITISNGQSPAIAGCTPHNLKLDEGQGGIFAFQFNTINKISNGSADDYQDYSCSDTTSITEGRKYKISCKIGNVRPENVYVWMDLNNNGRFDDSGEILLIKKNIEKTFTDSILIPSGALYNVPLRLRVTSDYIGSPITDACTNSSYGQTQDYAVYVRRNLLAPEVHFASNKKDVLVGDTVRFTDNSLNAPTYWYWSFPGGVPSESHSKNPSVYYLAPGKHDVFLFVQNANGRNLVLKEDYISVTKPAPVGLNATLNQQTGEVGLRWYANNGNSIASGNVTEDFNDGIADNFVFSDPCFTVENGYLRAYGVGSSWKCAAYNRNYQDFKVDYKFQYILNDLYSIGVMIRGNSPVIKRGITGYVISVRPYSSNYNVSKYFPNGITSYVVGGPTSNLNTSPGAWNTVSVEAIGPKVKIFFNGTYENEFIDSTYTSGEIVMGTSFVSGKINDVRWDYVNIDNYDTTNTPARFFRYYNVYRNGALIGTTTNKSYVDKLPIFGTYNYKITAVYYDGESRPDTASRITWANSSHLKDNNFQSSGKTIEPNIPITIFPNPTSDILNIEFAADLQITKVEVMNIIGNTVMSFIPNAVNGHLQMNLSGISSGYYTLLIHTSNGLSVTKIVKK